MRVVAWVCMGAANFAARHRCCQFRSCALCMQAFRAYGCKSPTRPRHCHLPAIMPASAALAASQFQLSMTQFMRPKPAAAAEGVAVPVVDISSDDGSTVPLSAAAGSSPAFTRRRRINDDDDGDAAPAQPAVAQPSVAVTTHSDVSAPLIGSANRAAPLTSRESQKRSRASAPAVRPLPGYHDNPYCQMSHGMSAFQRQRIG